MQQRPRDRQLVKSSGLDIWVIAYSSGSPDILNEQDSLEFNDGRS